MVLSTENNYYTNIILLVILLLAPISGLTVKISSLPGSASKTHVESLGKPRDDIKRSRSRLAYQKTLT